MKNNPVRIGVIGQACLDEIVGIDGQILGSSPGGILYSYAALERIIQADRSETIVVPFGHRSDPDRAQLHDVFEQLAHFDLSALHATGHLTNRVQLVYHSESHRTEHCPTILPPFELTSHDRSRLRELDALFVNMISGYDVTLANMQQMSSIACERGQHIHLDVHALVLGELSSGEQYGQGRSMTGVPQWRSWFEAAHSVQMNETEARVLAAPDITDEEHLIEAITQEPIGQMKYAIITRAERGATLFDLERVTRHDIPTQPVQVIDTTGCGDVFGAVFTYSIARGRDAIESVAIANRWAAWNTQIHGLLPMFTANAPEE